MLIGGIWCPAQSGETFTSINPSTEEPLCDISLAGKVEVDAAVAAARKAYESPAWSTISPHVRTRFLLNIADVVEKNKAELAMIETLDNGMPLWYSSNVANFAVELFRYYAGWPSKIFGTTNPFDASGFLYTVREPLGVCGQIIPWNVPLIMAAGKIANALACGNTVVLKPAELASLSTLRLAQLIQETDLPAGVVNIIPGLGPVAGAALANHPDVDKISFTGSTATGKHILQASIGTLKKVTLELGGKSPNIIFPDADLDKAVEAAVKSFCGNSGQICSAGTRLLVHESIHAEMIERLVNTASKYRVGSPLDPETKLGPLISATQLERVLSYIESGKREGAKLVLGGSRIGTRGYFVEPTIFSQVDPDSSIAQNEIFGPVLSVITFSSEADAIKKANQTSYGLAAAVWTQDISLANRMARALKAGRVWINTYGEADPVMPFGGYKQSGIGREFGAESIDAYTQTKAVLLRI